MLPLDPGNVLCGLEGCIRVHELSHIEDIKKKNKNICKGKKKGMRVVASPDERPATEIKAANAEIECLKALLTNNCGDYCKKIIEARIKEEEEYRDEFK